MDRAPRFLCDWLDKQNSDVSGGDATEAAEVEEGDASFVDELVGPAAPAPATTSIAPSHSSFGVNPALQPKASSQVDVSPSRTDSRFGSPRRAGSFGALVDDIPGKATVDEYIKKMPLLDIQEKGLDGRTRRADSCMIADLQDDPLTRAESQRLHDYMGRWPRHEELPESRALANVGRVVGGKR